MIFEEKLGGMMEKERHIILLLALSLSFTTNSFAETIMLKSGKKVEAKIIEKTNDYIKTDVAGVSVSYFIDEIDTIDGNAVTETGLSKIFEEVNTAYNSLETYKAKGTITLDTQVGGKKMAIISNEFSILLKKPNLYLISWTQKNISTPNTVKSGAVWSDGVYPYLYNGITNTYSKMADDQAALDAAAVISAGAAFTVPSIFLSVFKAQPTLFSQLINAKLDKIEQVDGEDCYVISGSSTISKKETFWISKSRHLIIKYSHFFEFPGGGIKIPGMTDNQVEELTNMTAQEITPEMRERMREIKGLVTELHLQISSPELSKADFQFLLPEGAILKESLFGGIPGDEVVRNKNEYEKTR